MSFKSLTTAAIVLAALAIPGSAFAATQSPGTEAALSAAIAGSDRSVTLPSPRPATTPLPDPNLLA